MTGLALAILAACIAFVLCAMNLFGVLPPRSWVDLTWSWVVAGLMVGAWWLEYSAEIAMTLGVGFYVVLTAIRTGWFLGSR